MTDNHPDVARQNWATNIQFQAVQYEMPETIEQLQQIVRQANKVRVVGSGHSFNEIANSIGTLISLDGLPKTVEFDRENHTATIHAGMTFIELGSILHEAGYALMNWSSIPHATIIGSCATATHGSGDRNRNLANMVSALELITAEGESIQLSREAHGDKFNGMVVALGGLGVVTKLTLKLLPTYFIQQDYYLNLPLADLVEHFGDIMSRGYSVSLFTEWQNKKIDVVWIRRKLSHDRPVDSDPTLFGAVLAGPEIGEAFSDYISVRPGEPVPWHVGLPIIHTNVSLAEYAQNERQTEYFVNRNDAVDALLAVESLSDRMAPFLTACEVRTVAADLLWLSPNYRRDSLGIHFSWQARPSEIARFLPVLEKALAPYDPIPHWGKLFAMAPVAVQGCYERLADFRALLAEFDPEGKFRNPFVAQYIGE